MLYAHNAFMSSTYSNLLESPEMCPSLQYGLGPMAVALLFTILTIVLVPSLPLLTHLLDRPGLRLSHCSGILILSFLLLGVFFFMLGPTPLLEPRDLLGNVG